MNAGEILRRRQKPDEYKYIAKECNIFVNYDKEKEFATIEKTLKKISNHHFAKGFRYYESACQIYGGPPYVTVTVKELYEDDKIIAKDEIIVGEVKRVCIHGLNTFRFRVFDSSRNTIISCHPSLEYLEKFSEDEIIIESFHIFDGMEYNGYFNTDIVKNLKTHVAFTGLYDERKYSALYHKKDGTKGTINIIDVEEREGRLFVITDDCKVFEVIN